MYPQSLFDTSRKEFNYIALRVKEGKIPTDWYGLMFVNSLAGNFTWQGDCPSNALLNSNGMILKLELLANKSAEFSTALMRTPCFYAEEATLQGSIWDRFYRFTPLSNLRVSIKLGVRNQLNGAIIPFWFGQNKQARLMVTFPAGAPFEINPSLLELREMIGVGSWHESPVGEEEQPFPAVLNALQPVFDPIAQEFFTVNVAESSRMLSAVTAAFHWREYYPQVLKEHLSQFIQQQVNVSPCSLFDQLVDFFASLKEKLPSLNFFRSSSFKKWRLFAKGKDSASLSKAYLFRWKGESALKQWQLLDEQGNPISGNGIWRLACTKDYLILSCTGCYSLLGECLLSLFPEEESFRSFFESLRLELLNSQATHIYLVCRKQLHEKNKQVRTLPIIVPECLGNLTALAYDNPNGIITLLATSSHQPFVSPQWFLPSKSQHQIRHIKIKQMVLDTLTGEYLAQESRYFPFSAMQSPLIDAFTYFQSLSANYSITHVYLKGCSQENAISQQRSCVICLNVQAMEAEEIYFFEQNIHLWSIQFVPRRLANTALPPTKNGYLLAIVKTSSDSSSYCTEIWVFDAAHLSKGPICKLFHPDFSLGWVTSSVWVEELFTPSSPASDQKLMQFYHDKIAKIRHKVTRQDISLLFKQHVYPNF